jgi:hypothetical protein
MTLFPLGIILYCVQAFICFVGIVGLKKWKQLSKPLRLFEVYILFSIAIEVVESVMAEYNIRNLWVFHCFDIVELFLYSFIFFLWYPGNRYRQLLRAAYGMYVSVWIIGKYSFEPFYFMDVYSGAISQIIQIVFGGRLLYSISQEREFNWKKDPRFLVISGIVLYASASFLLHIAFNVLLTLPRQTMRIVWLLNVLFVALQYIIFLKGLLCKPLSVTVN